MNGKEIDKTDDKSLRSNMGVSSGQSSVSIRI